MEFRDISADTFERIAWRQVERAFATLPDDAQELPWIGGWPFLHCGRAEQKRLAVAALLAVRWFEFEAPKWALPLLLRAEDCQALFNNHWGSNHRALLRGRYSMYLRSMEWVIARVTPFEIYCANELAPG